MTFELNNLEKIEVITSRLRNLAYNKYNLELSLLELSALSNDSDNGSLSVTKQISDVNSQMTILENEILVLQA
jgi:hypothetical protein